ncbi:hypothetical protein V6N13_072819 [Hibiscus sabdariffa]
MCMATESNRNTTIVEVRVTKQTNDCTNTPTEPRVTTDNDVNDVNYGARNGASLLVSQHFVSLPSSSIENDVANVDNNVGSAQSISLLIDPVVSNNVVSTIVIDAHVHVVDNMSSPSMDNMPSAVECVFVDNANTNVKHIYMRNKSCL